MELHDAFRTWLVSGERDRLPRDIAVHASACPDCLRTAGAFDALAFVDAGAAAELPIQPAARRSQRTALAGVARAVTGVAAVALIGAAGFVAANGLIPRATAQTPAGGVAETPEGVLGGIFDPETPSAVSSPASSSASADSSASTDAEASPTSTPAPTTAAGTTPRPTFGVLPTPPPSPGASRSPSASATPPSQGPSPSAGASATARPTPTGPPTPPTPTVAPTPTPTPTPEPTPTPVPTPTPTPQCSDGIDNDGDLLVDMLDPGCTAPDDDDEGGFILP